jgi:hypothetical protein
LYIRRHTFHPRACDARSSPSSARRGLHSGHCHGPAPRTSC